MPQFDFVTFFNQGFIVSVAIGIFYFTYLKFVLTAVFSTLRTREKIISTATKITKNLTSNKIISKIITKN